MKIVILGAGQVGGSVAESLVSELNEITIVDADPTSLTRLKERFDLRVVVGNAALPSVLEEAGLADADLLIAVTQSDQTNLCACRIAATLFKTPTRIARLLSSDYSRHPQLLDARPSMCASPRSIAGTSRSSPVVRHSSRPGTRSSISPRPATSAR